MSNGRNLRAVADRVEALMGEIGRDTTPAVRLKCEELVRLLMELYGAGLGRMLDLMAGPAMQRTQGTPGTAEIDLPAGVAERLADDELVASLLVLHGLHPWTVERRIERALARVRPFLGSHAGDVELLGVEDGVVHLRLAGSCNGCPSSNVTVEHSIRAAILEAAPEVTDIQVEGLAAPEAAGDIAAVASRLVQIESATGRAGTTLDCPVPAQAAVAREAAAHG